MVTPTLDYEDELWKRGYKLVCGIDEVGRGSFAGPLVVGAVIFPVGCELIEGVADSKLLNPNQRKNLEFRIKSLAKAWAVAEIPVSEINNVGIGKATQIGFRKVIKMFTQGVDFVLIDGFYVRHFNRKKQWAVVKGDQKCFSIAAASIIAKVYRDGLMRELALKYPEYGFARHKGYGTKKHQESLAKCGLSRVHRKSFKLGRFL